MNPPPFRPSGVTIRYHVCSGALWVWVIGDNGHPLLFGWKPNGNVLRGLCDILALLKLRSAVDHGRPVYVESHTASGVLYSEWLSPPSHTSRMLAVR